MAMSRIQPTNPFVPFVMDAVRDNPLDWREGGKRGTKAECLAYIKEVWTDMRPLSLR